MIAAGTLFDTNYGQVEVIEDRGWRDVHVIFKDTGYETVTRRESLEKGSIKDPTKPVVYGVGYTGVGKYKISHKFAKIWVQMLRRCYSEESLVNRPTYEDHRVATKWHNMQNFCIWCETNYVWGYELDKDIKSLGGKLYSEQTCMFIPRSINSTITSVINNLDCGLTFKNNTFYLYVTENGVQKYHGSYSTLAEGRKAYLNEKRRIALSKTQDDELKEMLKAFFEWREEN